MSGYVIDSSALIAILAPEVDAERFMRYLDENASAFISAATLHEAFCVSFSARFVVGQRRLGAIVSLIAPRVVAFDAEQIEVARHGYARFGRSSGHPDQINLGDCFSYALAKTRNLPLLFKGDDFLHTDVEPALKPV